VLPVAQPLSSTPSISQSIHLSPNHSNTFLEILHFIPLIASDYSKYLIITISFIINIVRYQNSSVLMASTVGS